MNATHQRIANTDGPCAKGQICVCHILPNLAPGGRTMAALAIARGLEESPFRHHLAVLEGGPGERGGATFLGHREGLDPGLFLRLQRHLRRLRPDIVHTHGSLADFYGAPAARLAGVPNVVITCHRGDFSQERQWKQRLRNQITFWQATVIVCVSRDQLTRLRRAYQGCSRRWRLIYLGTERSEVWAIPELPNGAVNPPMVLCTAHLRPDRDHRMLLRAFAIVRRAIPGARLLLAGSGEKTFVQELKKLAAELGIGDATEFLGLRADVPVLLRQSSVVVHPAVVDALPRSLIEATAAARPIVATRVGGIPEIVEDGVTGLIVEPGDESGMAAAITLYLSDVRAASRAGALGRARARRLFSLQSMLSAYSDLYGSLMGRSGFGPDTATSVQAQ